MVISEEGDDASHITTSILLSIPAIGTMWRHHLVNEAKSEYLQDINDTRESIICLIHKIEDTEIDKNEPMLKAMLNQRYEHLLKTCAIFHAIYGYHPYDRDIDPDPIYTV